MAQFEAIRESYTKFWELLSLEDFRKMVEETRKDDANPHVFPEIEQDAFVRVGSSLSKEELLFVKARKLKIQNAFANFIGVDPSLVEEEDIPVIGIASSGGGYRAMVASSAYMKAIDDAGLMDCVMYIAGVSGSTWTIAQYFSSLTNVSFEALHEHLKSHIHTHIANVSNFLTVLYASAHNTKVLLRGIIQRYYQQEGALNLVDVFGLLLGGTLLTTMEEVNPPSGDGDDQTKQYTEKIEPREIYKEQQNGYKNGTIKDEDGAEKRPRLIGRADLKLSNQRHYIDNGSHPMPIYCVVRHEIPSTSKDDSDSEENEEDEKKKIDSVYQWFEFTPYDMGSEEIGAWIPVWSFGRRFENGNNTERLPEQTMGILMGLFGSAFAASLAHFYYEIRGFLPLSALQAADETILRYENSMSTFHPISPATFPNPFYKLPFKNNDTEIRSESLVNSDKLSLMDAGMDNNIPFYPLLRKGRDVDVILALDLSASIQENSHFERAEGYVKRRGILGWPLGAGWPKSNISDELGSRDGGADNVDATNEDELYGTEKLNMSEDQKKAGKEMKGAVEESAQAKNTRYPLGTCAVFATSTSETTHEAIDGEHSTRTTYPRHINPITLLYFPLIQNEDYDREFDPQTAEFCSTWNFVYTSEQVTKLSGLAEANFKENLD
ncbi:acyl transferase/acyl hydrolase/lysophospholipase, partial [Phycomyces nitens]